MNEVTKILSQIESGDPSAAAQLEPGQSRTYDLTITLHADDSAINTLAQHGGTIQPAAK